MIFHPKLICWLKKSHQWQTIAFDRSLWWERTLPTTKEVTDKGPWLVSFDFCSRCQIRKYCYHDTDDDIIEAARRDATHKIRKAQWEQHGKIVKYNTKDIDWINFNFSTTNPTPQMETVSKLLARDKELQKWVEEYPTVKQEYENLLIALKMVK